MRVTIVGQAPSSTRNALPFDGPSGRRLARLAGLPSYQHLARRARLVNLLREFPGKSGKGDAFPLREARAAAQLLRTRGRVLLAGRAVATAFGVSAGYFEPAGRFVVIPHPSGVSHWWNEPRNLRRAARFLKRALAAR